jgi:hypothetical protein
VIKGREKRLFLAIFYKLSIRIQIIDFLCILKFVQFLLILGEFRGVIYLMRIKLKNKTMDK